MTTQTRTTADSWGWVVGLVVALIVGAALGLAIGGLTLSANTKTETVTVAPPGFTHGLTSKTSSSSNPNATTTHTP
jgi:hypothetical protein